MHFNFSKALLIVRSLGIEEDSTSSVGIPSIVPDTEKARSFNLAEHCLIISVQLLTNSLGTAECLQLSQGVAARAANNAFSSRWTDDAGEMLAAEQPCTSTSTFRTSRVEL